MENAVGSLSALLDELLSQFKIRNDAALARKLQVAPPVLSKLRHGKLSLGPVFILKVHDTFGIPVKEIRRLAGQNSN